MHRNLGVLEGNQLKKLRLRGKLQLNNRLANNKTKKNTTAGENGMLGIETPTQLLRNSRAR